MYDLSYRAKKKGDEQNVLLSGFIGFTLFVGIVLMCVTMSNVRTNQHSYINKFNKPFDFYKHIEFIPNVTNKTKIFTLQNRIMPVIQSSIQSVNLANRNRLRV